MTNRQALLSAWKRMIDWRMKGKFRPTCEEDVQCFLYHGIVLALRDASAVLAKPRLDTDVRAKVGKGRRVSGDMQFPDLTIGWGRTGVIVEIKYVRKADTESPTFGEYLNDVKKLRSLAAKGGEQQVFVVYDENDAFVFMDEHQRDLLKQAGPACHILHYPETLNKSPVKGWGRKAWETMRKKTAASA